MSARGTAAGPRVRVAGLMLLVGLAAVVSALARSLAGGGGDWRDRLVLAHVVAVAVLVPLGTGVVYVLIAAGEADLARRDARTALTFAIGGLGWVFVLGSLAFWAILIGLGA